MPILTQTAVSRQGCRTEGRWSSSWLPPVWYSVSETRRYGISDSCSSQRRKEAYGARTGTRKALDYHHGKQTDSAITMISIDTPIEREWPALTDPAPIRQYFHATTMAADWRYGGAITWRGVWHDRAYEGKGTVLSDKPPHLLNISHRSPLWYAARRGA